MNRIKSIIFFFSLFYLTLYVPFSITAYSQTWYEFNYQNQNIEKKIANKGTINVIDYFLYKDNLNFSIWSLKEIRHFSDVRLIYLILHIIAIISLLFILYFGDKKRIKNSSLFSIELIVILGIFFSLVDFSYFWNTIFHPLLFNNLDWIYTSSEISYYLFPQEFFINSIIFILLFTFVTNLVLYFLKYSKDK